MKIVANITFKSVLQEIKDIEKRNEYFDWLDDEGKRLEIAWDCLQLVLSYKIKTSIGFYWGKGLKTIITEEPKEFQRILNEELPDCRVCARGALMLAQIRLGNNIDSRESGRDCGIEKNIQGFTYDDFIGMELEFETDRFCHPYQRNSQEKLANILCNVLVNGNFNKEDKTDYLTVTKD